MINAAGFSANCQDVLFNVDQSATARKNIKTGKFVNAEVKDAKAIIVLQKHKVVVDGETKASYTLAPKATEIKLKPNVVSYTFNGKDEKNAPISFSYTVNRTSKEAIVEVKNNKIKSYYFGTYAASDLTSFR